MTGSFGHCPPVRLPLGEPDAIELIRASVPYLGVEPVDYPTSNGKILRKDASECPHAIKIPVPDVVLAIGAFDGFHLGHQALVEATVREAGERGAESVALMFDPDPSAVVGRPEKSLLGIEERAHALLQAGVDYVMVVDFDEALASCPAKDFLARHVLRFFTPASVHVGEDFRFGARGEGDTGTLEGLGDELGFSVHAHPLVEVDGEPVSASRIRAALGSDGGGLDVASELLGRCHVARGVVVHGRGEGTSLGFPTANVRFEGRCLPEEGVYGGYVVRRGDAWPAAINVGPPYTFTFRGSNTLEANLMGFVGNLYDEEVSVVFVKRLRGSRHFSSIDDLKAAVMSNIEWVRENLGCHGLGVWRDQR